VFSCAVINFPDPAGFLLGLSWARSPSFFIRIKPNSRILYNIHTLKPAESPSSLIQRTNRAYILHFKATCCGLHGHIYCYWIQESIHLVQLGGHTCPKHFAQIDNIVLLIALNGCSPFQVKWTILFHCYSDVIR
jgi:hypothetical protein